MSSNVKYQKFTITKSQRAKIKNQKPCIIWLTGLSGSGKSTIANELDKKLYDLGYHSYILDGDNIRFGLNKELGFSKVDREENIRRVSEVAKLFLDSGLIIIVAFISPFFTDREKAKSLVKPDEFIEVFVDASLEECVKRDTKGLYKKAIDGKIDNFTGYNSPYEIPKNPDIHIKTTVLNIDDSVKKIIYHLKKYGYIKI
jgi:adenylylsulfate kinase